MPQPIAYNAGLPISGSIQENNISYVVDGQQRNYRGGFGGLSWMSEVPPANNLIFIGNSTSIGRGPANIPLFYPAYNNSSANIVYAANTLPGSPRNFTTTASAYDWAVTNNFFINNSDNPIPRIDADGLAFYLDANQASSYPQTGTTWYDLSGRANNGTLTNGPTWNSNGWFQFDGVDDFVSLGNLGTIGDNQAIEIWFNSNSVTSYKNVFDMNYLTYNPNTGNVGPRLEQNTGAGINIIWSGNTTNNGIYNFTPIISISANRWYHTVFTLSSGNYNWYLNGNLEHSGTSPQGYVTTYGDVNLGRGFVLDPSRFFSGLESSARVYSRTLTTAEIKQNYFQSNIVQDGLVFMVDANNIVSYEGSGTTAYSLTGSNTGTLTNGVGFSNSNGGTWVFDGVDDFINFTNNINPTSSFSCEAWINFSSISLGGSDTPILAKWSSASAPSKNFIFGYRTSGGQKGISFYLYDSSYNQQDNYRINWDPVTDVWYHVVGVFSANNFVKIYIDAVEDFSRTSGVYSSLNPNSTENLTSGFATGLAFFPGKIANAKIYNRALTPAEIQQNYQATEYKFLGPQIVTNGLVLNLDAANKDSYPGTGTTWTDLSGNGNNGTLINGPSFLPNQNGGTISLDGVDDYVNVGCTPNTIRAYNSSTEFVIKLPLYSGGQRNILSYRTNVSSMYIGKGSNGIFVYYDTLNIPPYTVGSITNGSIAHCVVICDATNNLLSVYINGTLAGSVSRTGWSTAYNNTLNLGYDQGTNEYMVGDMYLFRHYNRTLSATEVTQNYNATKGRFGL